MKAKPFRTQNRKIEIYLIHSPETGEVFVGKCWEPNSYQAYKDHVRMQKAPTKTLFEGVKKRGIYPKMYLLERLETTEVVAYGHIVAWTKYFSEAGFTVLTHRKTLEYADDLTENNRQIYEQICTIPLEEILAEDKILVGSYVPMAQKQAVLKEGTRHISVVVTPEEYEIIKKKAEEQHMTISKYCRKNILDGGIIKVETHAYTHELFRIGNILRIIADGIYYTGAYDPTDIEKIQNMIDELKEQRREVMDYLDKQFVKILKNKRR